jgi:hypothetical protein
MKWKKEKKGDRTLFFDGDEHIATVLNKGGTWFTWYTHEKSGSTDSFDDALKAIRSELE